MVKLSDAFKTQEIELASLPGSKLEVKSGFSTEEYREIAKKCPNMMDGTADEKTFSTIVAITKGIVSWNLEGDDGQKLEITEENVGKLPMNDLDPIIGILFKDISKKK